MKLTLSGKLTSRKIELKVNDDEGIYTGQMMKGRAHGFGSWVPKDGKKIHTGFWRLNLQHGYGVCRQIFETGRRWEGEWK